MSDDLKQNAEGYPDPTAYFAIKKADRDYEARILGADFGSNYEDAERFHKLLESIFTICELSDFHIEGRIVIKDKRTGKVWR